MTFDTHVSGLTIHELLRVISNAALSGVLTVDSPAGSGRIVFTWGRVTHAAVEGQERIGEMLIRQGHLTEEQLATALETQTNHRRPRPLGTIITSLGYADTATVGRLLREQMKFAFFEMMRWTEGTARLDVDIEVVLASVRLDVSLDTPTLLLEAARRRDEANGAPGEAGAAPVAEPLAFLHPFDGSPFEEWQILKAPGESAPADVPSPVPTGTDGAAASGAPPTDPSPPIPV